MVAIFLREASVAVHPDFQRCKRLALNLVQFQGCHTVFAHIIPWNSICRVSMVFIVIAGSVSNSIGVLNAKLRSQP
jgi:hypothetical protein